MAKLSEGLDEYVGKEEVTYQLYVAMELEAAIYRESAARDRLYYYRNAYRNRFAKVGYTLQK